MKKRNRMNQVIDTIDLGQVCQHSKKNRKSNVHGPRNLKIHFIFLNRPRIY